MIDFPINPSARPQQIPYYPMVSTGYATLATEEDIEKDESGITYPDLHRRIDVDMGLHTFVISVFGQPILKDSLNNDLTIPDISTSEELISTMITNSYDVNIVNVGQFVKNYVTDWVSEGFEAKFIWIVRSPDDHLTYEDDNTLIDVCNAVYRGEYSILEPDTDKYKLFATIETDGTLSKDTYTILTSATSSFRVTEHHTHDEDSNSEIP